MDDIPGPSSTQMDLPFVICMLSKPLSVLWSFENCSLSRANKSCNEIILGDLSEMPRSRVEQLSHSSSHSSKGLESTRFDSIQKLVHVVLLASSSTTWLIK